VLIGLAVEFADDLRNPDTIALSRDELEYSCQSIFSGISSLSAVFFAYDILARTSPSSVAPVVKSIESLKGDFGSLYHDFIGARNFERRCRLLLDMFKLQIVFAGLLYGNGE